MCRKPSRSMKTSSMPLLLKLPVLIFSSVVLSPRISQLKFRRYLERFPSPHCKLHRIFLVQKVLLSFNSHQVHFHMIHRRPLHFRWMVCCYFSFFGPIFALDFPFSFFELEKSSFYGLSRLLAVSVMIMGFPRLVHWTPSFLESWFLDCFGARLQVHSYLYPFQCGFLYDIQYRYAYLCTENARWPHTSPCSGPYIQI